MPITITAGYAALLALFFVGLSITTIRKRRNLRVPIMDGGHPSLARLMRAHGNFAEYVPFILLLMLIGELNHSPHVLLHSMGTLLILGRACHVVSLLYVEPVKQKYRLRVIAMVMTFTTLVIGAVNCLGLAI